ncbi:Mu transposase C-terminal domain-containing protein [Aeromicrobium sp. 50.2.37]|uniref:Mu transposase C-terminal domain-containing protein n=1 Tax=Aeromicrobium sp. 50.2.37 TaxID=2969305 RepID=UPI00214FAA3B|nr:Mu transposase C-terminal domain-containing protein [Aeromicrobium sp. 50.2.37]MCR4511737.1 Mu transposase C-terminal domain-containing protein [Aeromicrobium sp. 50.2.37]
MRASERTALNAMLNQAMTANGGVVTGKVIAEAAGGFGISTRTVRRHLAALRAPAAPAKPGRGWWNDRQENALVLGAVAGTDTTKQAWARLRQDGTISVGYVQFTKDFNTHVPPAVAAALRGNGREDYLNSSIYCVDVPSRPNTRWQADSQEVPVWVRPDNGQAPFKPWQVTFIDEATRMVMATILLPGPPGAEDALAALAAGIRGFRTADGTFVGGIPATAKWDNGTEFVNRDVSAACMRLSIAPYPAAPYSPWQKGKVERWHQTIQSELYAGLPGASDGPRSFGGREYWRGADSGLLPFSALVLKLQDWVVAYNTERPHSELSGTPLDAWKTQAQNIVHAEPEQLHSLMLRAPKQRTVSKDGIRFEGRKYLSPAMAKYRGRKVDVRYLPLETETIFVFDGDDLICEAAPAELLDPEGRRQLVRQRHADWQAIKAAHERAATRRAQVAVINAATAPKTARGSRKTKADKPAPSAPTSTGIFADQDALLNLLGDGDA